MGGISSLTNKLNFCNKTNSNGETQSWRWVAQQNLIYLKDKEKTEKTEEARGTQENREREQRKSQSQEKEKKTTQGRRKQKEKQHGQVWEQDL